MLNDTPRRLECAVSGGLVVVLALLAFSLIVGIVAGLVFTFTTYPWAGSAFMACALCLAIGAIIKQVVEERSRRHRSVAVYKSVSDRMRTLFMFLLGAWLEYATLVFFVQHPTFTEALGQSKLLGYAINITLPVAQQTAFALICAVIWSKMDRRGMGSRFWPSFIVMLLPIWAVFAVAHLPFFDEKIKIPASIAATFLSLPLVAATLGLAYKCQENIFDKLRLRYG